MSFPLSLDGNDTNRGQGQEGIPSDREIEQEGYRQYAEGLGHMIYNEYVFVDDAPDFTVKQLEQMWLWLEKPKTFDPVDRCKGRDLIMQYVDWDKTDQRISDRIAKRQKEREQLLANKPKTHASHELGSREFTLTYSPKWFDDETARAKMRIAIERLVKYYKDEIVQLRAIGEVGTNGLSHVHCFYKLVGGLKITDKNFKRAWSVWNPKKSLGKSGHEGGHHANVRTESDFLGYIEKDIEEAWLEVNIGGGV